MAKKKSAAGKKVVAKKKAVPRKKSVAKPKAQRTPPVPSEQVGGQVFAGVVDEVLANKIADHAAETSENERAAAVFAEPEPQVEKKSVSNEPHQRRSAPKKVSPSAIVVLVAVLLVLGLLSEIIRRVKGK